MTLTPLAVLVPGLMLAVTTLAAAMPWGVAAEIKPVMPLLPWIVCHFWVERREHAMPDWLVFLSGLATDVLGQGPLGYWALVYLTGFALVSSLTHGDKRGLGVSIALFAVTANALVILQWLTTSLYYLRLAELWPLLMAAAMTTLVYAVLALIVPVRSLETRRFNDRLERGA